MEHEPLLRKALSFFNDYYDNWPRWLRIAAGVDNTEEEMKESDFWGWLRDELTITVPTIHIQRIESGSTASGIPDVNLCVRGVEAWLELKVATLTKRNPVRMKIRFPNDQAFWLARRCQAGGHAYLLVAVPKYDESEGRWGELLLYDGAFAPRLVNMLRDTSLKDLKDHAKIVLPKERGECLRVLIETVIGKPLK